MSEGSSERTELWRNEKMRSTADPNCRECHGSGHRDVRLYDPRRGYHYSMTEACLCVSIEPLVA